MRILDKNTDFYDFYQNVYRDDSVTFDRTDSFLLTKELMCEQLWHTRNRFYTWKEEPEVFLLLQIGNTFWLFLLEVTAATQDYDRPSDYSVCLVTKWKNYNKPRHLIRLNVVGFSPSVERMLGWKWNRKRYLPEKLAERAGDLARAVDRNDFKIGRSIDRHTILKGDGKKEEKHIPLLKACGIANCVDALDVFLAFEEYFSLEKTSAERTESAGLTDKEKIGNHGFDVKTSFRGKMK